jgi:tripartite-type tricarboxylate transporter receptor subunit TctC
MIQLRRCTTFWASIAAAVCAFTGANAQQDYPNRVVQIVNPTLAGSTTDVLVRVLANGLSTRLGQQFVIVNRPGAGGAIGTLSVARAEPDGHTLWFGAVYALSVLTKLKTTEAGYEADALAPICQTVSNAMVMAVRADSAFKTLADLVAAARREPGKLNYGHQGAGSIPNLSMEEFLDAAQLKVKGVPYRGDPAVITDLLGGNIDVAGLVQGTAAAAGAQLRILGIFSEERHPAFPGVPTVKEQGYDVAPISFGGLMAPKGTPDAVIAKLAGACAAAAKDEAYATAAKRGGQPDAYYADLAVFRQRLARDIEAKQRLLTKMGLAR